MSDKIDDIDKLRLQHCELMLNQMQLVLLKLMAVADGITIEEIKAFEKCFENSRVQIVSTNAAVAARLHH